MHRRQFWRRFVGDRQSAIQEGSRFYNVDPFESLEPEQIIISGNDHLGVSGDGTLQDAVIIGIICDGQERNWIDLMRNRPERSTCHLGALRFAFRLSSERK